MEKEDEEKENQILQNLFWFGTGSVMAGTGIFGWDGRLGTMVEEDGGVEEFSTMINELWSSIFRSSHKRRDVGDAANDELYGVGVEDNLGLIFALIPKLVQDGSTKMKGNRGELWISCHWFIPHPFEIFLASCQTPITGGGRNSEKTFSVNFGKKIINLNYVCSKQLHALY